MSTTFSAAILQLHAHFKAEGQVEFLNISTDPMRPRLRTVEFGMKDRHGNTHVTVSLCMEFDPLKLRSALQDVDPEGQLDILDDKDKFVGFMKVRAFEVIQYLGAFNGVADDYTEIAKLIYSVKGAIHGDRFGV